MTPLIDHSLKQLLAGSAQVFWAGRIPPIPIMQASERILDPDFDFRMPPVFHQNFDLVYLVERDLGRIKAWPLILDEALRLLRPGGILIIRMTNTPLLSIFELKHQLFMWAGIAPHFETTCDDGSTLFAVRNTRDAKRPADLDGYSFGVITDGKRQDQLFAFLKSVAAVRHKDDERVETIVCGPPGIQRETEQAFPSIVFAADDQRFSDQGWITKVLQSPRFAR